MDCWCSVVYDIICGITNGITEFTEYGELDCFVGVDEMLEWLSSDDGRSFIEYALQRLQDNEKIYVNLTGNDEKLSYLPMYTHPGYMPDLGSI